MIKVTGSGMHFAKLPIVLLLFSSTSQSFLITDINVNYKSFKFFMALPKKQKTDLYPSH